MVAAKRWYQNAVVIGSLLVLLPFAVGFGMVAHRSSADLDACLNHIQQQVGPDRQKRESDRLRSSGAADESHDAADADEQVGASDKHGTEVAPECTGHFSGAGEAISRASFDLSLLGFYATIFFGTIGVLGIFLSFSSARDASDQAARQTVAALPPTPTVRDRSGVRPMLLDVGLVCLGLYLLRSDRVGRP